jgi:predicted O-linked N-acetylglucosamine transferase (SPINDLY family)
MSAADGAAGALAQAMAHHRAGRLAEAEGLYRSVCNAEPGNARAFHLLGVVSHQLGRPDAAGLLAEAVRLAPDFAEAHNDRGVVLAAQGRFSEALASFERALALNPAYGEAHSNLARGLRSVGRLDEAARQFELVLQGAPGSALAHFDLATVLQLTGRAAGAEQHYRAAIALRDDFMDAHLQLARLLQELGRPAEAFVHAERAVTLRPGSAGARNNLGNVLRAAGRPDQAIEQYEAALRIDPTLFMAHYNCGVALRAQTRIPEARQHFARAVALKPGFLEAELALCVAELPALYENPAEIAERRDAYATRLDELCAHVEESRAPAMLLDVIGAHQPFYLPYQGYDDRKLQSRYGGLVCEVLAAKYPHPPPLPAAPAPDEPVRLGIVSGFFRQHSNWKIPVKGWVKMLDRKRFHVSGYYTIADRDDETELAAKLCDRFVQGPLALDDWRRIIMQDAPHVLIYPEIGMDRMTAQLAAQRLAPVQCCSWGHPVTSGFATIDYFISSDLMEPDEADDHYCERLIRLPNLSIYYEPAGLPSVKMDRSDLGLRADAIVYWCCQSLPKYLPQFDDAFARIALDVPGCQFTFIEFAGGESVTRLFRNRLEGAFARHGLSARDHCIFLPRLTQDRFVAAIGQCDIVLDSIGWSGCNSVMESLVHNLPIVTLAGTMMRGRHSAAILDLMAVGATTAKSVDEYVAIARQLGRNGAKRAELSAEIAAKKDRVYRDRKCIDGLEAFLARAARGVEI